RRPLQHPLVPYTTLFRSDKPTDRTFENVTVVAAGEGTEITERLRAVMPLIKTEYVLFTLDDYFLTERISTQAINEDIQIMEKHQDRKSTRLNSSHVSISY